MTEHFSLSLSHLTGQSLAVAVTESGAGVDITRGEGHNCDKQGVMKKTDSWDDFNFMIFHPIHLKMPRMFVDWMG